MGKNEENGIRNGKVVFSYQITALPTVVAAVKTIRRVRSFRRRHDLTRETRATRTHQTDSGFRFPPPPLKRVSVATVVVSARPLEDVTPGRVGLRPLVRRRHGGDKSVNTDREPSKFQFGTDGFYSIRARRRRRPADDVCAISWRVGCRLHASVCHGPHSIRACLTGLRMKAYTVERRTLKREENNDARRVSKHETREIALSDEPREVIDDDDDDGDIGGVWSERVYVTRDGKRDYGGGREGRFVCASALEMSVSPPKTHAEILEKTYPTVRA